MTKFSGKTILLVDDEEMLRGAIAFELELEGAKVLQSSGGHDAFEIIQTNDNIDLLISDIKMPNGNGIELMDKVKKHNPVKPTVLFISGFSDLTPDEAYAKGVAGFISKPFDPENFIATVSRAIKSNREQWVETPPRLITNHEVEFILDSYLEIGKGRTLNISRGGMFIATDNTLPKVGDIIKFSVKFNEDVSKKHVGKGIVRWKRESEMPNGRRGYGIEFFELEADTVKMLEIYLTENKSLISFIPSN